MSPRLLALVVLTLAARLWAADRCLTGASAIGDAQSIAAVRGHISTIATSRT